MLGLATGRFRRAKRANMSVNISREIAIGRLAEFSLPGRGALELASNWRASESQFYWASIVQILLKGLF
jgi:hypothetical protein